MNFLLDTNLLSEPARPNPDAGVVDWLASADEDRLFISAVTLAELSRGVARLPEGAKKRRLEEWMSEQVHDRFEDRILAVDAPVGILSGRLMASSEAAGRPMKPADGFLAATALHHRLVLVTRNVRDFEAVLSATLNPWSGSGAPH